MDRYFGIPLVDEPIGDLVARIESDDADVAALVASPRRRLAFRTFAYLRLGLLLGEMLVDSDVEAQGGGVTWIEALVADPNRYAAVVEEARAVAREVAADPKLAGEEGLDAGAARERFRRFVRDSLADDEP